MVVDIAQKIRSQIAAAAIAAADKTLLIDLLQAYERDFLALVAPSSSIATLIREMNAAADRVAPLVKQDVNQANQTMATKVAEIDASSQESAHWSLSVMGCAIALVDHRTTFLLWWKESMDELSARRELLRASTDDQKGEAKQDLRRAIIAKLQQLNAIRGRLLRHGERVLEVSQRLQSVSGSVTAEDLKSLEHAAEGIAALLDVLTREEAPANESAPPAGAALATTSG